MPILGVLLGQLLMFFRCPKEELKPDARSVNFAGNMNSRDGGAILYNATQAVLGEKPVIHPLSSCDRFSRRVSSPHFCGARSFFVHSRMQHWIAPSPPNAGRGLTQHILRNPAADGSEGDRHGVWSTELKRRLTAQNLDIPAPGTTIINRTRRLHG